jgi:hypothetical protein
VSKPTRNNNERPRHPKNPKSGLKNVQQEEEVSLVELYIALVWAPAAHPFPACPLFQYFSATSSASWTSDFIISRKWTRGGWEKGRDYFLRPTSFKNVPKFGISILLDPGGEIAPVTAAIVSKSQGGTSLGKAVLSSAEIRRRKLLHERPAVCRVPSPSLPNVSTTA